MGSGVGGVPAVLWFVVVNAERRALSVWGAALGENARAHADEIRARVGGCVVDVVTVAGVRPRVGSRV